MFVPKYSIDNIPTLVQIMALRRSGDMPLSEPMMVSLLTHICVSRLSRQLIVVTPYGVVSSSIQLMVLVGTKPLLELMATSFDWFPRDKLKRKLNQNTKTTFCSGKLFCKRMFNWIPFLVTLQWAKKYIGHHATSQCLGSVKCNHVKYWWLVIFFIPVSLNSLVKQWTHSCCTATWIFHEN